MLFCPSKKHVAPFRERSETAAGGMKRSKKNRQGDDSNPLPLSTTPFPDYAGYFLILKKYTVVPTGLIGIYLFHFFYHTVVPTGLIGIYLILFFYQTVVPTGLIGIYIILFFYQTVVPTGLIGK